MATPRKTVALARAGVRRIYWTPADSLPRHLMLSVICGIPMATYVSDYTEVPFAGKASYTRESLHINSARAEKSTLEFRTDYILPEDLRIALIVELMTGMCVLIGTREPNHPVVEYKDTSGDPSGEAAVRTYTVTHTDIRSGLPVMI